MNKQRRGALKKICDLLSYAAKALASVQSDEQMAYDNLPENFQESERGDQMMDNIEVMDNVSSMIDEARDLLEDAIFELEYI